MNGNDSQQLVAWVGGIFTFLGFSGIVAAIRIILAIRDATNATKTNTEAIAKLSQDSSSQNVQLLTLSSKVSGIELQAATAMTTANNVRHSLEENERDRATFEARVEERQRLEELRTTRK